MGCLHCVALAELDTIVSSWDCRTNYQKIRVELFLITTHLLSQLHAYEAQMSAKLVRNVPARAQHCLWAVMPLRATEVALGMFKWQKH